MKNVKVFRSSFFLFFSIFLIASLPACWFGTKNEEPKKMAGLHLISVLSKQHHDDCHIKGSVWVPIDKVEQYAQKNLSPDAEIIFYCNNYMCASSGFARKRLIDLGFKNVLVYEGGVAQWLQKGYPTIGQGQSGYLKRVMKEPKDLEFYVLTAEQLKQKLEENKKI